MYKYSTYREHVKILSYNINTCRTYFRMNFTRTPIKQLKNHFSLKIKTVLRPHVEINIFIFTRSRS